MIENNNKAVINRVINRSIKNNKMRNAFVILAIVLTTFMISSVFTIGFSFLKNYKTMTIRTTGTTANVVLTKPTAKQIDDIKKLEDFDDIGTKIKAGKIESEELLKNKSSIRLIYNDSVSYEQQTKPAISDIVGEYPTKENEIMASKWSLDELGIKNPEIGMKIKLTYKLYNNKAETRVFTLSGYYKDYNSNSGEIWVSKEFVNKNQLTLEKNGAAFINIKSSDKGEVYDNLKNNFKLNKGQEINYVGSISSSAKEANIGVVVLVGLISLFIVISGYLLIYNVLYIGVSKDIRFFGLLKTIGTSPKQIKSIVKGQAIKLSYIGIPIGIILSLIVSFWVVPLAMTIFQQSGGGGLSYMPSDVSFNPFIFIGTIVFAALTTALSCRKPAKIASSISPIEALNFVDGKSKGKKKVKRRKGTNGSKIYKMAFNNVFRIKKRAIIVFISMFMGIITFLSVNTFISSLGLENYIKIYVPHNFNIEYVPQIETKPEETKTLDEDFINKIKSIEGVETIEASMKTGFKLDYEDWIIPIIKTDLAIYKNNNTNTPEGGMADIINRIRENENMRSTNIISIDDSLVEKWNKESKNPIDLEAFKKGETVLITPSFFNVPKECEKDIEGLIGQTISGEFLDKGIKKSYKIAGILDANLAKRNAFKATGIPFMYISNNAIKSLTDKPMLNTMNIDVNEKYEIKINDELKNMLSNNASYNFTSRIDRSKEFATSMQTMNVLGGGMGVILMLIGLLNFINIMITGINVRMKELAVMESVGMTKKQIKKMITFEGFYYALITSGLILTLGIGTILIVANLAQNVADYAEFVFPGYTLITIIILIFIICISVPRIIYKFVSKKTAVERLRINN